MTEVLSKEHVLTQLPQIMDDLQQDKGLSSRTGKLWIEYIKMVRILLLVIRAERSGDWDLHLYCIAKMIPVLHAGGHTCAKSSRLYLDQMNQLKTKMNIEDFTKYTSQGYWTIRRSNRFRSGNFTDQTIEQVLVRMLKSPSRRSSARSWCHNEYPIKMVFHKLFQFVSIQSYSVVYTPIQLISTRTYALPEQPVMAFTILGLKITLPSTPHSSTRANVWTG